MTTTRDNASLAAFGPTPAPGGLYVGPTLRQRLDLVEHLLEFGRQIIVLCGPPGSGKSTLLDAIGLAAGENWACVRIHGGPALGGRALLAQIADALDVDLADDGEPRMAQTMLRLRLNVLERAGKLVVLLIDDADQLPPDSLAFLVALARTDDQSAEARVLLAADHDHAGLLANLQRDRPQHGLVHVVEIPPVSEGQVRDFLARRLAAVGAQLENCLDPADVQAIASAAGGNPARIVALARQQLAGQGGLSPPRLPRLSLALPGFRLPTLPRLSLPFPAPRPPGDASRFGDRRLLPLFLLPPLVAGAAWWFLHDREPAGAAPATSVVLELPPPAPAAPAADEPPTATPANPPAPGLAAEAGPDPDPTEAEGDEVIELELPDEPPPGVVAADAGTARQPRPDPTLPPPAGLPPRPTAGVADAPPDREVAAGPGRLPRPVPPVPAVTPQSTPTPAPAEAAARAPNPAPTARFTIDWLLRQAPAGYTLQLAGLRDRAAGERFIARHGLAGKAALLATRRNGQAWYVLLHGYYADRRAALDAANRLPPAVRKEVKPWARTVGEIAGLPR